MLAPRFAFFAVPLVSTDCSTRVVSAATAVGMTRVRSRRFVSSTSDLSSRSATFEMPTGPSFAVPSVPVTRRPPSARLE